MAVNRTDFSVFQINQVSLYIVIYVDAYLFHICLWRQSQNSNVCAYHISRVAYMNISSCFWHVRTYECRHVCGCRLMSLVIALRSTSCCFGPNPSCWYGSNTVFPLNQMKKVKRTTPFPQPEGSARIARTFCLLIQDNKGATPAQVIITTLAPVWNNNDA